MFFFYLALGLAGLVGTSTFNIRFMGGDPAAGYLASWFANDASSSAAVDLLVVAAAAVAFMLIEGRRVGLGGPAVVLALLTPFTALAFTFPVFLALRHRSFARDTGGQVGHDVAVGR